MEAHAGRLQEVNRVSRDHLKWLAWSLPHEAEAELRVTDVRESAREILAWAFRQGTGVIVSENLLRVSTLLPSDVRALCWAHRARAQRVWAAYVAQVGRVAEALSQAGCHWVLLKGAAFAVASYPEPWLRTCGDIDVVVSVHDLEPAHEALVKLGFQQDQKYDIRALAKKIRAGRARLQHLPPYFQATGDPILPNVVVELHHRLTALNEICRLPGQEILANATSLSVAEWTIPVPRSEINFLIAAVHAYRHARSLNEIVQGKDLRLNRFVDVVQLLRRYGSCLNWEEVREIAKRNNLERALAFVRAVVEECWGSQPWPATFDSLKDYAGVTQEIADATLFGHEAVLGHWSLSPAQRLFQPQSERCFEAMVALYAYLQAQRKAAIAEEDRLWDTGLDRSDFGDLSLEWGMGG